MRRVAAAMLHLQEVADGVVHVALDVPAHGFEYVRMVLADVKGVECIRSGWRLAWTIGSWSQLSKMLPSFSLDQPVEGVIDIVIARLDALVPEVDSLLRVVLEVGDVAHRVVGVV